MNKELELYIKSYFIENVIHKFENEDIGYFTNYLQQAESTFQFKNVEIDLLSKSFFCKELLVYSTNNKSRFNYKFYLFLEDGKVKKACFIFKDGVMIARVIERNGELIDSVILLHELLQIRAAELHFHG